MIGDWNQQKWETYKEYNIPNTKELLEKIKYLESRIPPKNTYTLKIGSNYLISSSDGIEMVKVSAITKECVLFESIQAKKSPTWFILNTNYKIIEELSIDFMRDFKINQISK